MIGLTASTKAWSERPSASLGTSPVRDAFADTSTWIGSALLLAASIYCTLVAKVATDRG